jgi:hypothetical protein
LIESLTAAGSSAIGEDDEEINVSPVASTPPSKLPTLCRYTICGSHILWIDPCPTIPHSSDAADWNCRKNQVLARRLKAARLRGNTCLEEIDYRASRDSTRA